VKITIVSPVFPYPNAGIFVGIERYIQYLSLSLKTLGINVQIITSFWNGGSKYDNYKGIPIIRVLDSKKVLGKFGSFFRLNNITLGLNLLSKRIYKRYFNSNLVILAQPFGFTRFLKIKGVPTISIAYHYNDPQTLQEHFEFHPFHLIQKIQLKIHKNVVAISEATKTTFISKYHLNGENIKVISIGVDDNRFNPSNFSKKIQEKYGTNLLLYVGPFEPRKRIPILLKSMPIIIKKIPNVHLILIGKGPFLNYCKKLTKSLGIQEHVSFLGFIRDEELLKYYASSTLFVFPSEIEGFGQVILESMASGTPVICANKLPMSEIITNGGITFKLNDSNDLAEKIIDLLDNKEKRLLLKKNTIDTIKKKNDWLVIAKEFIEYAKSLKKN